MILTENGRIFLSRLLAGKKGEFFGVLGTGATEPSVQDTQLENEVFREKVYDIFYFNKYIYFVFYLPTEQCNGLTITEVGLLGKVENETYLICRALLDPPIEKEEELGLIFQISLSILNEGEEG